MRSSEGHRRIDGFIYRCQFTRTMEGTIKDFGAARDSADR
jgi:hypothetical protein